MVTTREPIPRVGLYAMRAIAQKGETLASRDVLQLLDEVDRLRALLADADESNLDEVIAERDRLRAEVASADMAHRDPLTDKKNTTEDVGP